MAILKLSSFVSQISGKINGTVFCKTNYGQIVKNNSYSLPQFTPLQTEVQSRISHIPSLWQSTTPTQKEQWQNATVDYPTTNKVGETVYYTAYALFLFLNQNLNFSGLPTKLSPPVFSELVIPDLIVSLWTTSELEIAINDAQPDDLVRVFGTFAFDPGQNIKNSDFKEFANLTLANINNFYDLSPEYFDKFGAPIQGKRYGIAINVINHITGQSTGIYSKTYKTLII